MRSWDDTSDEALLLATGRDPEAYAAFYRRHEEALLRFFVRRTADAELALDLTAETFAAALVASRRFKAGSEPATAWFFGIARRTLAMSRRRGRVEQRARQKLGMPPLLVDDALLERIEALAAAELLGERVHGLPLEQRQALLARVVDEREYADIAAELRCSQAVVRKRVSRALQTLRAELETR